MEVANELHENGHSYFRQALNAMNEKGASRDEQAICHYLNKAIEYNYANAYKFLAYQYIGGRGVEQSAVKACHLLLEGAKNGDTSCYKTMWDVFTGRTVANVLDEDRAEQVFGWFLQEAAPESHELTDYLDHSYSKLAIGASEGKKFPIISFPGKHVSEVLFSLSQRAKSYVERLRDARIHNIEIDRFENWSNYLGDLHYFLSMHVSDPETVMKSIMENIEKVDLEYIFSRNENSEKYITEYLPYLPGYVAPSPKINRDECRQLVEECWRNFLKFAAEGNQEEGTKTIMRFDEHMQQKAKQMPQAEGLQFWTLLEEERELLFNEYKRDPDGLKRRLNVIPSEPQPVQYGGRQNLGQVAVNTAVRATVWESVRAIFRMIR
jgi:hypothetical protein